MNNMTDKYNLFFSSIKEFALDFDLVTIKNKADKKNIPGVGNFTNHNLCDSIRSFLSFFEAEVDFKNNGLGGAFFNYSSIMKSQKRALEQKVALDIKNIKLIKGREESVADFSNCDILFLKYDEIGSSFMFVDGKVEDPITYIYWEGGGITSNYLVFTSYVRDTVFWEIIHSLDELLNKISWLRFYSWFIKNHRNYRNELIRWRYEFNSIVGEKQMETKELLGIDEFEIEFIKFLIENKGVESPIDFLNPNSM